MPQVPAAVEPGLEPAIADQVRMELLIRHELDRQLPRERKTRAGEIAKHPAVLLFLTFVLTTVVGSLVTSWWQYQQWQRQEALRASQEKAKARVEVINLTAQSIAESFAAAEDVLHLFAFEWHRKSQVVTLSERAKHWTERSRQWRVAEKVLVARVSSAFPDARIRGLLQSIMEDRTYVGNDIENLLSMADTKRGQYSPADQKEIKETVDHALHLVNGVSRQDQKLAQLIGRMIEETRVAEHTPPPKPFWSWFFGR